MEKIDNFEELVPAFGDFITEGYHDSQYGQEQNIQPQDNNVDFEITGVSYDDATDDFVFAAIKNGLTGEIRLWTGDNSVIQEIDPNRDLDETEYSEKVQDFMSDLQKNIGSIPQRILDALSQESMSQPADNTDDI